MKNVKLYFLGMLAVVISACDNSDYSEAYVDAEEKVDLVAILDVNRTQAVAGTNIDLTVTLPQAFDVDSELTIRIANVFDGVYEVTKVTVPAGTTVVKDKVIMPKNIGNPKKYEGTTNAAFIQVDGLALDTSSGNVADPYRVTSNKIYVTLLDGSGAYDLPYPVDYDGDGVIEPWLSISLDWEGPYTLNDLDLFVDDEAGTNYEDSQSGNRFEGDYFNGNWFPDGVYYVKVNPWKLGVDSVNARFSATDHTGKTTIVEAVITKDGGSQVIATITKSGGATNDITYIIAPAN